MPAVGRKSPRKLTAALIVVAFTLLAVGMAALLAPAPRTRVVHVEAFRYGFSPWRVEVNRGDLLRLTFSTRDTGQSFFLQDYDLHVVITPGTDLVEVHRLSRPHEPPTRQRVVELKAGLPGWSGWLVAKSQFRNHTYNGPLHGTERGDLVVRPNFLLAAGLGLLLGLPLAGLLMVRSGAGTAPRDQAVNLFTLFPRLKRLARLPSLQFNLTLPMLAVFYFVILAGLLGTKVSGRNAAPMVIWVLWLSVLIVVLVPLGGRIWCLVCPLPSLGEWLQRRRLATPGSPTRLLKWPRWLGNAWPRTLLFLLLGTFSLALVAIPAATSWLLAGLAGLAVATAFFQGQRLFCRHLCPINGFISLYAMTGRLMARSISGEVCARCNEHFCLNGNSKGFGCPYGLCMGEVDRNNDCGLCTECVKTCAYDNVAFFWRRAGWDRRIASHGEAWQAIVLFGLSLVYSIVNLGPWHQVRDWIDIVDQRNWLTFSAYAATLWVLLLGLLPLCLFVLTLIGTRLSRSGVRAASRFRSSTAALVPLGLSLWIAFALATFSSMLTFALQTLSDPLNWGWDLLGRAGSPWHILWAPAIPWLQVSCVVVGLVYSLKTGQLGWRERVSDRRAALLGSLPMSLFLWIVAIGMVCFYAG
jgi:hypothetical protein